MRVNFDALGYRPRFIVDITNSEKELFENGLTRITVAVEVKAADVPAFVSHLRLL